jgi:hypothetical protein
MNLNIFLILWTVGVFAVAYGIAAVVYSSRGITRGREIERMEPPANGVMHFAEGAVVSIAAHGAENAIDRLCRDANRRGSLARRVVDGGWS